MIGQRIESRPGSSWGISLSFAVAVALFAWGVVIGSPHPIMAAVLPLTIGVALVATRPAPFAADVTEIGLNLFDPPRHVPYAAIEGLSVDGKPTKSRAPLYVVYPDGVLSIPPRLNVSTPELFGFLAGRIGEGGSRDVPAPLMKYLRGQAEIFGDTKVFSFRARPHPIRRSRKRDVAICLALVATGGLWLVAGILGGNQYFAWSAAGGMVAFMSALFAIGFAVERQNPHIRNWRASGLVIGPAGLALVQGDVRGEMCWPELRDVEYRHKPRSFRLHSTGMHLDTGVPFRGIRLVVAGATIVIADIYDRPLPVIYDRILTYWQGRDANA